MSFYGLLNLPWWGYVIATLVMTHITMIGITVFLHRCQAHKGLTLHPVISHFLRMWLYLTTGMKTKEWVAVHRKHHAKCETKEDPHSPVTEGISKVMWEGAELYRTAKKNQETLDKYGKGTPDDWVEKYVYSAKFMRGKLGIVIMLAINLVLFGVPGLIIWGIQMMWTPFFAAGVINGIGHYFGYRNFECNDASRNIVPWGILICGEELHNNHHSFGTSAKLSVKWWEFDLGWAYIKTLSLLGLAKVKRLPPQMVQASDKIDIDMDTVKAFVTGRVQLMANYSSKVIVPVFKKERKTTCDLNKYQTLSSKAKRLIIKNKMFVAPAEQQRIEEALEVSSNLRVVCQFRDKLQQIWGKTTASQAELLASIKDWCQQAEQSGIESLQDFAKLVKGYQLKQAT